MQTTKRDLVLCSDARAGGRIDVDVEKYVESTEWRNVDANKDKNETREFLYSLKTP